MNYTRKSQLVMDDDWINATVNGTSYQLMTDSGTTCWKHIWDNIKGVSVANEPKLVWKFGRVDNEFSVAAS